MVTVDQSHKNPCSVAALLRGNFGSLVDFAEIFTKIHGVLLQNSLQVLRCFHGNFHKKIFCFVKKFPQKLVPPCWKFPQKFAFLVNFHQKMPLGQISTKKSCPYAKFPQKFAWLENFDNNRLCCKIFAKSCFVRTFPQNLV